jgi:hypothetical protein
MDFGSAGVGIVEIAPGEHVHAPDAAALEVADVPGQITTVALGVGECDVGREHAETIRPPLRQATVTWRTSTC